MKLDRQKFWQLYHAHFGEIETVTQKTVDALNAILDKFETEKRLTNAAQFAYVLATAYHESGINGNHFVPVKEGRERKNSTRRSNQDRYWNTGFYGRGLIQTTWEEKYLAVGELLGVGDMFVQNPDLLLDINWAYEALVAGMVNGIYRKDAHGRHTLQRHLPTAGATLEQLVEAREIVNGDKEKNGLKIANYAVIFEATLNHSLLAEKTPMLAESESAVPHDAFQATAGESADESNGNAPSSADSNSDENNTAKEIKTSETKETAEGSKSVEVTEKTALGDAPDAEPRHRLSVEDWKPWVFSKLKLTWGSFTGLNFSQGTGFGIAALKSGEYWYVPLLIGTVILVFTFIVCVLLSLALLAIWHFNRKEIVEYIKMSTNSIINPESFNLGLKFEPK